MVAEEGLMVRLKRGRKSYQETSRLSLVLNQTLTVAHRSKIMMKSAERIWGREGLFKARADGIPRASVRISKTK